MTPALLIRMSILVTFFFNLSTQSDILVRLARSIFSTDTSPLVSDLYNQNEEVACYNQLHLMSAAAGSALERSLHNMMTLAPLLAMSVAVILPMPVLAPVMTTVLPSSLVVLRHWPPCKNSLSPTAKQEAVRM